LSHIELVHLKGQRSARHQLVYYNILIVFNLFYFGTAYNSNLYLYTKY